MERISDRLLNWASVLDPATLDRVVTCVSQLVQLLDEIPQGYKDIDQVIADAADLVEVRHTLRQLVNVKGT